MGDGRVTVEWIGGPQDGQRFTVPDSETTVLVVLAGDRLALPIVRGRNGGRYVFYPKAADGRPQ